MKPIKRVAKLLDRFLSDEFVASRPNGMTRVHYLEGHTSIYLANKIFGFDGWDSHIMKIEQEVCDQNSNNAYNVAYSCLSRITVRVLNTNKEIYTLTREDIGWGSCENVKSKVKAFENSKKEAVTDALKRCLRQFGTALGNCCYDKTYLSALKSKKTKNNLLLGELLTKEELRNMQSDESNVIVQTQSKTRQVDKHLQSSSIIDFDSVPK